MADSKADRLLDTMLHRMPDRLSDKNISHNISNFVGKFFIILTHAHISVPGCGRIEYDRVRPVPRQSGQEAPHSS